MMVNIMATAKKATKKKASPKAGQKITPQKLRFVDEYLIDFNGTQAAIRAKYSPKTANQQAARLLGSEGVQNIIQKRLKVVQDRAEIKAADVLKHWADIGLADASDLMEMRRTCCRYCHGDGHRYFYTPAEYERALLKWEQDCENARLSKKPEPLFDAGGGVGYNRLSEPHNECPECFGEGEMQPFFKDTRTLSPAAKKLFAGVKVGKEGIAVLVHDQMAAMANIARHLGMFNDKKAIDLTSGGKPLEAPTNLTAEQMKDAVRAVIDDY